MKSKLVNWSIRIQWTHPVERPWPKPDKPQSVVAVHSNPLYGPHQHSKAGPKANSLTQRRFGQMDTEEIPWLTWAEMWFFATIPWSRVHFQPDWWTSMLQLPVWWWFRWRILDDLFWGFDCFACMFVIGFWRPFRTHWNRFGRGFLSDSSKTKRILQFHL